MNFRDSATENRIHSLGILQSGHMVQLFGVVIHFHAALRTDHLLDRHVFYLWSTTTRTAASRLHSHTLAAPAQHLRHPDQLLQKLVDPPRERLVL